MDASSKHGGIRVQELTLDRRIDIRRLINSDAALSVVAAGSLFDQLSDHLGAGDQVALDFEGIRNATTVFLNTAVGQLYGCFEPDFLDERLQFVNANPLVSNMLRMTIKNAKLFYADNGSRDDIDDEDS